jgi:hypothetical protein
MGISALLFSDDLGGARDDRLGRGVNFLDELFELVPICEVDW